MNVCSYCGLISMFDADHLCTGVASLDDAIRMSGDQVLAALNLENRELRDELEHLRMLHRASQAALNHALTRLEQAQALT